MAETKPDFYPVDQIILGLECGASNTTSGLAANPSLGMPPTGPGAGQGKLVRKIRSIFFVDGHYVVQRSRSVHLV
ncbi:UxaA family hydrolase [Desulfoscipio geothermicus]|uniref:UxaA family hydrolase n=1 Tax=Desulfoscipio geothermicus TaxID=39060 RepID=UPI0013F4C353